jgi:subtilase family serine protease
VTPQATTSGTVSARVYLAGRDQAGLTSFAAAVSTPGNKLYGKYLTPSQMQSRYGPTDAQVTALKQWLTGAGLTVTAVHKSVAGYIAVTGSLAAAQKAFGVTFGSYQGPDKKTDRAPQQQATAPSSVADAILTVTGLDTASHNAKPLDTLPPPGPNYWVAPPTSAFYGQRIADDEPTAYGHHWPWAVTGYTPKQVRGAYGVDSSGMTGKGQTVAIVDAFASPTMASDAQRYANVTGDPKVAKGQYKQYLPSTFDLTDACDAAGWYGEETLDVESVHGMAPGANVRYVAGQDCTDSSLDDALSYIVNHKLASIVSNSWGEPFDDASDGDVLTLIFKSGAAEGIGFFFSSGDSGYESPAEDPFSDQRQVDSPVSNPWATGVGGTSVAIGSSNNYEWETSWGTMNDPLASNGKSWQDPPPGPYPADYDGSGGGGVSTTYSQPWYQRGIVPFKLATHLPDGSTSSTAMRVVPDISAYADPGTGFLVGQTTLQPDGKTYKFSLSRIGGTSVACPTMAGIQADAQQAAGHALGFANPAIYQRYGTSAYHDVTDYPQGNGVRLAEVRDNYSDPYTKALPLLANLRTLGINGEGADALPAVQGYDDATGVGSPRNYVQSYH